MARPKSPDPRTETLRVRVTPGEKARIGERAVAAGMEMAEFMRIRALGEKPRGIVRPEPEPQRAPGTPSAAAVSVGVERQTIADEVAEAQLDDPTARDAFVKRRTLQLQGERGMTSLVARGEAVREWETRGTKSA